MSTFDGKLLEIQGISLDRFDGPNLNSQVYFLSHCHIDHMVGLNQPTFHQQLIQNNKCIYLSHVSAEILRRLYPAISSNFRELDFYSATAIEHFSVIPIPAGHCPGSIMLLFQTEQKTILYTGDYRINQDDIHKLKAFYNHLNILKTIDKIYLDTTFFLKAYQRFPPRADSLDEICSIIEEWVAKSDKNVIKLQTSAKYGYEYLFIEIYKRLKMPIHVNDEVYNFYSMVPEMDRAITKLSAPTQIHCACGSVDTVICRNTVSYNVKTIKISAWRWHYDHLLQNGISENPEYKTHNVCYATHASYEEGVALLRFLKPKEVEANVLHNNAASNDEIYRNINECLNEFKSKSIVPIECKKLFDIPSADSNLQKRIDQIDEPIDFSCSILDSPPRKRNK